MKSESLKSDTDTVVSLIFTYCENYTILTRKQNQTTGQQSQSLKAWILQSALNRLFSSHHFKSLHPILKSKQLLVNTAIQIQSNCDMNKTVGLRSGCLTCVDVLAGFVGMHGAMTNRGLHCPLWLDYTSAGKKLIDGRAEVCDLGGFQGPIVQLCLSHTLS